MPIKYNELNVPGDSFIARYMASMAERETPHAYDFWCAIWGIGVVTNRDCVVNRPGAEVHLNWYLMLVAESGVTRKSTSVRRITKIIRNFCTKHGIETDFVETKTTPEALEMRLDRMTRDVGYSHTAISISELATFLGREKYNLPMPALLTDLYDCHELRSGAGTISRGDTITRNLYVSFLSASTPSWLRVAVSPDVIEGGFTSRTLFIVAEKRKKKIAWPEDENEANSNELYDSLKTIRDDVAKYGGDIKISAKGLERFKQWYHAEPDYTDPFRSSWSSRADSHVLRLAACLSINDRSWQIDHNHIDIAIKIIGEARESAAGIFNTGIVYGSQQERIIQGIRRLLIDAGVDGISQSDITRRAGNYAKAKAVGAVLAIFLEHGLVNFYEEDNTGKKGPKKVVWQATKSLVRMTDMTDVINELHPGELDGS